MISNNNCLRRFLTCGVCSPLMYAHKWCMNVGLLALGTGLVGFYVQRASLINLWEPPRNIQTPGMCPCLHVHVCVCVCALHRFCESGMWPISSRHSDTWPRLRTSLTHGQINAHLYHTEIHQTFTHAYICIINMHTYMTVHTSRLAFSILACTCLVIVTLGYFYLWVYLSTDKLLAPICQVRVYMFCVRVYVCLCISVSFDSNNHGCIISWAAVGLPL